MLPRRATLLALGGFLGSLGVLAGGCGGEGDTTVINTTTTVVREDGGTTGDSGAATTPTTTTTEAAKPPEEFSGPCGTGKITVPPGGKIGYEKLEVGEASCDYATDVATAWSRSYGPDCYGGCEKQVEGIPCTFDGSRVICAAARTEVRWEVAFLEPS